MPEPKEMMAPHWLDQLIFGCHNAHQVAMTLAFSPQLHQGIEHGIRLARQVDPRVMGPSAAQVIREEILRVLNDPNGGGATGDIGWAPPGAAGP
jgi:hypothetical protein